MYGLPIVVKTSTEKLKIEPHYSCSDWTSGFDLWECPDSTWAYNVMLFRKI